MKPALILIGILLLGGCASRIATAPAKTISADLSSLHGDLSKFQEGLGTYQATEQARTATMGARKDAAAASVRYSQDAQLLLSAKSETELFVLLQSQGRDETARASAVAVAPKAPTVKLPLDKLAEAAKATDGIAKPRKRKAEVKSLIDFARATNTALNAAQESAKPKSGE